MARPGVLVAVWLAGVTMATGVAWGAVQVVGDSVGERPLVSLPSSTAEVPAVVAPAPAPSVQPSAPSVTVPSQRPPAVSPNRSPAPSRASSPVPTRPRQSPPPVPPPSPAATTRTATFSAVGGKVAVTCTGATASMRYASPSSGFASEVESGGPVEVEVRFRSSDHESRIRVECVGGSPDGRVEEHGGSGKG